MASPDSLNWNSPTAPDPELTWPLPIQWRAIGRKGGRSCNALSRRRSGALTAVHAPQAIDSKRRNIRAAIVLRKQQVRKKAGGLNIELREVHRHRMMLRRCLCR